MNRFAWSLKGHLRRVPVGLADALSNRRWVRRGRRFLVVRHAARKPSFHNDFLQWLELAFPDLRAFFELRILPCRMRDPTAYLLHIPWLQDPLEHWSPGGYAQALRLAADCDRHGIPVVNRVDRHLNASKTEGARRMAQAGLRTARMIAIDDVGRFRTTLGGMGCPLIIRENWGHGRPSYFVEKPAELANVPLKRFSQPIAAEFVDVRSRRDGLYRRYRYLTAGDVGVSEGMFLSERWEVRGKYALVSDVARREWLRFATEPNPHHHQFQLARRLLGFDLVAFDYSYDRHGRIVVWEANPYPDVRYPGNPKRQYVRPFMHRVYASMLSLYLHRAGVGMPAKLEKLLTEPGIQRLRVA